MERISGVFWNWPRKNKSRIKNHMPAPVKADCVALAGRYAGLRRFQGTAEAAHAVLFAVSWAVKNFFINFVIMP